MSMPETGAPDRVRFGVFEADLRTGELRKGGLKVRLQEQPFQVLALLLARPGETVTRDEFRNRLWAADTFVDFEHGLNKAINKIREALGDSATSRRFVETVARRGYRFLADVAVVNGSPLATAEASTSTVVVAVRGGGEPAARPERRRRSGWRSSSIVSGVALTLASLMLLVWALQFR